MAPLAWRTLDVSCWAALAVVIGTAGLRLAHLDAWVAAVVLCALAPLTFLLAYPVVVVAALRRRRVLAVVALAGIGLHLAWFGGMLPILHRSRGLPAGAAPVRVMSANVLFTNTRVAELSRTIDASHPDLLALEEATARGVTELERAGGLAPFPYRVVAATNDADGIALYSRLPIRDGQVFTLAGRAVIRAEIETSAGALTVYVAHPVAPVTRGGLLNWRKELAALTGRLAAEPGRLLVVGDFNATDGNRQFTQMLDRATLRDALDATGRGYSMTWPRDRAVLPTVVRPDHVLTGRGVVALRGRTAANPGSDHRAVVADVGVRAG